MTDDRCHDQRDEVSDKDTIEALERELFPSVPKLPEGEKPADSATRDVCVA